MEVDDDPVITGCVNVAKRRIYLSLYLSMFIGFYVHCL